MTPSRTSPEKRFMQLLSNYERLRDDWMEEVVVGKGGKFMELEVDRNEARRRLVEYVRRQLKEKESA